MRGYLKRGYKLLKTNGKTFSVVDTEGLITLPKLLTFREFLDEKEGYVVWSDRKVCLLFQVGKYEGEIIKKEKDASTVQSEV